MAKYLAPERPVFALQPVPRGDGEGPNDIAEVAAQYVGAITEIQSNGPYVLVGYSLGGLIVYEAARILRNKGEQIALLALLDSYPDRRDARMAGVVRGAKLASHAPGTPTRN